MVKLQLALLSFLVVTTGCEATGRRFATSPAKCVLFVAGENVPALPSHSAQLRTPDMQNVGARAYNILLGLKPTRQWLSSALSTNSVTVLDLASWEQGREALLKAGVPIYYPKNDVQQRRFTEVLSRLKSIDAFLICSATMDVDERPEVKTHFDFRRHATFREQGFEYTVAIHCQYRLVSKGGSAIAYSPGLTRTWSDWRSHSERLTHFPGDYWKEVDELIADEADEFVDRSRSLPARLVADGVSASDGDEVTGGPMAAQQQPTESAQFVGKGATREEATRNAQRDMLERFFLTKPRTQFPWSTPDRHVRLIKRVLMERSGDIVIISGDPIYSESSEGWTATIRGSVDSAYANTVGTAVRDYLEKNGNPEILVDFDASPDIIAECKTIATEVEKAAREAGFTKLIDKAQFEKNLGRELPRFSRGQIEDVKSMRDILAEYTARRNITPIVIWGELRRTVWEQSAGSTSRAFPQFIAHFYNLTTNTAVKTYSDHASALVTPHESSYDVSAMLGENVGDRCAEALARALGEMALSGDDVFIRFIGVDLDAREDAEVLQLVSTMPGVTNALLYDTVAIDGKAIVKAEIVLQVRTDVSGLTIGAALSEKTLGPSRKKLHRREKQNDRWATIEVTSN